MQGLPFPFPNFGAITDPTAADDIDSFYEIGSIWVNTLTPSIWMCVDNSRGAAAWMIFTASSGGSATGTQWRIIGQGG